MNCEGCGAPMQLQDGKDFLTCEYCKAVYFPEQNEDGVRVFPDASELACPLCKSPLAHATVEGCRILYCARCRGMLVRMEVFMGVIRALRGRRSGPDIVPPSPRGDELRRRMTCPQCRQLMDTHYYAGPGNIVIDDCSKCHLDWLDYGELQRVVRAPDHSYDEDGQSW